MRKDHKIGLQSANNRNELLERNLDFQCTRQRTNPSTRYKWMRDRERN